MVVNVLSRQYSLLSVMEVCIRGLQFIKEHYKRHEDFSTYQKDGGNGSKGPYILQEGFLFKGNQLCISMGPICKVLAKDIHSVGRTFHVSINKIITSSKTISVGKRWGEMSMMPSYSVLLVTKQRVNFIKAFIILFLYHKDIRKI